MKRYCFRIGVLGILVLLGWIAVAYAQRGGIEAATEGNPLRDQPAAIDTIPDAADLDLPPPADRGRGRLDSREVEPLNSPVAEDRGRGVVDSPEAAAVAEATASDGPALAAPPAARKPAGRSAPVHVRDNAPTHQEEDRDYDNRKAAPRAASENEEPARFTAEPFDEPAAMSPARSGNLPAARENPSGMRALRASTANPPDDGGAAYAASPSHVIPPNNAIPPNQANPSNTPSLPLEQVGAAAPNNPAGEGTGQPGAKQLEGPQSPQVTIQKVAPPEIQVGRTATFKTIVRNTGPIPANQVEVRDMIPKGTRLLSTAPRASQGPRGEVIWTLGTLRPGEESTVEMELMPAAEGEIGSVATVHFGADASAKTICTRPDLAVQTTAPAQALIGEKITMTITVTNPGSGVATGVVLEEHLPAGLQHPAGSELEYNIGTLKPGESKKLDLELVAAAAGPVANLLSVRADGNLRREDRLQLEVVAPKLDLVMEGPKKRYLEREATYQLSVTNPGTAAAQGVELAAYLPPGMKFVSANNQGHYDEASRAVYWRLEQLPTRETGTVELVALPVETGQQSIKLRGSAQKVQSIEKEQPVVVEGIAAVMFQVADSVDPIEVGGEATYEVRVVNQGSKAAGNVQLMAALPPEMQPLSAEGPTRYAVQGNNVIFEGLARLAPKAEAIYRLRVKGVRPGDLVAKFQIKTDEIQRWITKEESTQVFADE
ncbi:MAG: DUF11 domain-containing protein [Pirellulales bacterium]|nr:DUF11 domain-containing protein [Pirellulales bacterium]